jgi:hypothetical protein
MTDRGPDSEFPFFVFSPTAGSPMGGTCGRTFLLGVLRPFEPHASIVWPLNVFL